MRWPGAAQVGRLERVRHVAGDVTREVTLVVTSLPAKAANAEAVLGLVRGHWGSGNRLPFVRDVTLGEDACRVRSENAPHVFAALRNPALNLLRGAGHDRIASATRDERTEREPTHAARHRSHRPQSSRASSPASSASRPNSNSASRSWRTSARLASRTRAKRSAGRLS